MLPIEVYNHVKYGNGGRPGATATVCGHVFVIEGQDELFDPLIWRTRERRRVIKAWRDGMPMPLRDMPSELCHWWMYFTHAC